jgi:hypothetical protein
MAVAVTMRFADGNIMMAGKVEVLPSQQLFLLRIAVVHGVLELQLDRFL